MFNLPVGKICNHQPYQPWISQVINLNHLHKGLSAILIIWTLVQIMLVCRLLEVGNTEGKNNFLKFTIKVESHHLRILLDKQWRCYLDQLGSIGDSDLSPCQTPLKSPSLVLYFLCCSIERVCPIVREDRHSLSHKRQHSHTQIHASHVHTSHTELLQNTHVENNKQDSQGSIQAYTDSDP